MNNQNNINTLDEALRVLWLESSKEADLSNSENEINNILNTDYSIEMPLDKQTEMIEKLSETLTAKSFGEVLILNMNVKEITNEKLSEETNLPIEIIEDLKKDKVYTNNIPVVLLKGLLGFLDIPFQLAENSIFKTFEILQNELLFELTEKSGFKPVFRKGYHVSKESIIWNSSKSEGKELFENKESLNKYINRLKELMNN